MSTSSDERVTLAGYARPVAGPIAAVVGVTCVSNLLALLTPAILAVGLAAISNTVSEGAPAGGPFDLNQLGGWILTRGLGQAWAEHRARFLMLVGGAYLGVALLVAGLEYWASLLTLRIRTSVTAALQRDLSARLLSLPLRFFHHEQAGELMSRVTQDAMNVGQGLGPLVRSLFHHGIQLAGYSLYLLSTSPLVSVAALGVIGLHAAVNRALTRPMRTLSRELSDEQARLSADLQEVLSGVRVFKSMAAEALGLGRIRRAVERLASASWRQGKVTRLEEPLRAVVDSCAIAGVLAAAATQVGSGRLSPQGLLLYLVVARMVIAPARQMGTSWLWLQGLLGSFERARALLRRRPSIQDGPLAPAGFERELALREVRFGYGGRPVIHGVSLAIRKGEMVALVGPSGAGKSTLADLMLRLHDPDEGAVLLDGTDVRRFQQAPYRRLFGVVPQEPWLMHETVRENLRFGRAWLLDAELEAAARIADAHGFITALPRGYDTVVGDRGVRLSGGERQRVALARALAGRPQILILDEATSALDSESERQVQEAFERVRRDMTSVVIAHRLSSVAAADRIVVIESGRMLDTGRHQELLARCELYRRLCERQFAWGAAGGEPERAADDSAAPLVAEGERS